MYIKDKFVGKNNKSYPVRLGGNNEFPSLSDSAYLLG
jgi:hypothetical protein